MTGVSVQSARDRVAKRGELLCFDVQLIRMGNTSVTYEIDVLGEKLAGTDEPLFVINITALTCRHLKET